jgi:hypothetical protein
MFRSTARLGAMGAVVVMAGCGFSAGTQPSVGVDAGSHAGTGGGGAAGGGAGGRGGGGGSGPLIIIVTPDAGNDTTDGSTISLDSNCGTKTQTAKMIPPNIMLVMDRSLSMTNDVKDMQCPGATGNNGNCGANSKWELTVPVLSQVITNTDAKVNWGMFYLGNEPAMCGVAAAPVVPIAPMNATAITTSLTGNVFNGQLGTPTRRAIQGAVSYLTGLTDPNPKFILLATDGQPNCATATSLNTDDSMASEQAVADALAMGIPTFVVGIGNTGAVATMNRMAIAGGRPQAGGATSYYQVDDAAALSTALGTIVGQTASCSFEIGPAPDGTTVKGLGVFGDGAPITMDPANGWSFKNADMTSIILTGQVCDQVLSGTIHDVTVAFVCAVQ